MEFFYNSSFSTQILAALTSNGLRPLDINAGRILPGLAEHDELQKNTDIYYPKDPSMIHRTTNFCLQLHKQQVTPQ